MTMLDGLRLIQAVPVQEPVCIYCGVRVADTDQHYKWHLFAGFPEAEAPEVEKES